MCLKYRGHHIFMMQHVWILKGLYHYMVLKRICYDPTFIICQATIVKAAPLPMKPSKSPFWGCVKVACHIGIGRLPHLSIGTTRDNIDDVRVLSKKSAIRYSE